MANAKRKQNRTAAIARLAFSVLLAIAAAHARRLPIQVYSTAQGMPRNSTTCLVPDPKGFLWICTSEGLVRFDGSEFRAFDSRHGLPASVVYDFLVGKDGGYWVLTLAGLCRLPPGAKAGEPCRVLVPPVPGEDFITDAMAETRDGTLWMMTTGALYRLRKDSWKPERILSVPAADRFEAIGNGPSDTVLMSTDHGFFVWDGTVLHQIDRTIPADCNFGGIHPDSATQTWVSTSCGLLRLVGSPVTGNLHLERAPLVAPPTETPASVVRRRDGSLWLAAGPNLVHARELPSGALESEARFGVEEGVPHQLIEYLVEDSQGNLWGASEGLGIFRVAPTGFQAYYESDGLGSARISSLFEDLAGELCVTTSVQNSSDPPSHLKVKRGDVFERVEIRTSPTFRAWGWGWNQFGQQARDGQWWFPGEDGLYRYAATKVARDLDGRPPLQIFRHDEIGGLDGIFRIFEDSHGDIWLASISTFQLIRWERATGQFRHFSAADGWAADSIGTAFREARDGSLWIGTFTSVLRLRNGHLEDMHLAPPDDFSPVRDLYIDRAGRVWVATAHSGLFRCDRPEAATPVFRHYTPREGLSSSSVRSLTEDNAGFLYAGTVRGVDRIDPGAPLEGGNVRHYGVADGLPDAEQNVALRDRHGHLWFGSLHGLAEFDPAMDKPLPNSRVYIRHVRVRGDEIPLPWAGTSNFALALAPEKNQVEIEFAAADLRAASSLRYQYKLEGVDRDWSAPAARESVNYANLPPGKRSFVVRVVGPGGEIGENFAAITLELAAPLWRRWWFLSAAALAACFLVYWLYDYRVQHLLALERLRTHIATDLHDDIGSSLTQISLLSEVGQRDATRNVLAEIAQISRDLGREMADIVWAVSPRHDRFEALAHRMRGFAEDALPDGELTFDITGLPGDLSLPIEYRRPVFLIFKEAVNNVARHSRASHLTVRLSVDAGILRLAVQDDGDGFDPTAEASGEGLNSIRRRVKNLGGNAEWDTAPGQGTKFQVTLPLRK
jgi:signal transduction histidine kinase/ligand-binding sensor domain-containing protein